MIAQREAIDTWFGKGTKKIYLPKKAFRINLTLRYTVPRPHLCTTLDTINSLIEVLGLLTTFSVLFVSRPIDLAADSRLISQLDVSSFHFNAN